MPSSIDEDGQSSLELDDSSQTQPTPPSPQSSGGTGVGINLQQAFMFRPNDSIMHNAGTVAIDPTPLITYDADGGAGPTAISGDALFHEQGEVQNDKEQAADGDDDVSWHHPISATKSYFSTLSSFFSWKFLSWLGLINFAVTGGVFTLVMSLGLPLFKELGIDASRQQLYMTLIMSPWAMKPFIGVASDLFPIRGYNKRYFAIYSILIGLVGCVVLLVLYHSGTTSRAVDQGSSAVQHLADIIVICFTAVSYESATLDILGEGKYSELMRKFPESGSSIISFKFGWALAGSIITQMYVGPLSDRGHWHVLFWIALALALSPLYPTIVGWLPEKKKTSEDPGITKVCPGVLFDKGSFLQKKIPFIVITVSGLAGPLLAAVTTYADLTIGLIASALMLVALALTTYFVFPRVVYNIILSVMLMSVSSPSIGSALSYFYTADEQCLPDGPHFNYTYYITLTGIVGSVVNFVAVVLYQSFMSTWRFRPALIFTIVVGSLAPIVDLIIVMRWNIKWGISDELFFLLGNAVFESLVTILIGIPMSSIFAKIAPPGMESAVYVNRRMLCAASDSQVTGVSRPLYLFLFEQFRLHSRDHKLLQHAQWFAWIRNHRVVWHGHCW
eukprot:g7384.t1.1.5e17418a g7384  g7384.t1 contig24:494641-496655(+)